MSSRFQKTFWRYGVPFLVLVVGGSFGLKEFTTVRYQFRQQSAVNKEDLEALGIPVRKGVTLESEFEKVQKEVNIDEWENKRGPRPWEEKL